MRHVGERGRVGEIKKRPALGAGVWARVAQSHRVRRMRVCLPRVTHAQILDIAKLPSLDEMRAQLVGLLSTPASRLVQSLDSHPQELAAALARYSNPPSDDAGDDAGDA